MFRFRKSFLLILVLMFIMTCFTANSYAALPANRNTELSSEDYVELPSDRYEKLTSHIETIMLPLTLGRDNPVLSKEIYSGTVTIIVSETGQCAGTAYNDAFYLFTDGQGNLLNPPEKWESMLLINDQPVFMGTAPEYPLFEENHVYNFRYTLSTPGQLAFSIGDYDTGDNTGGYRIEIYSNPSEILTLPLTLGRDNPVYTIGSYSDIGAIIVRGTGQCAGASYNDAFYLFSDERGNLYNPPEQWESMLLVNDQPVFYEGSPDYPAYQANHAYKFGYTPAKLGQLAFSIGDYYTGDNTGGYIIEIYAAPSETITLPLTFGRDHPVYSSQVISASATIVVSGTGQAAGDQYNDAFYIFSNGQHNLYNPPIPWESMFMINDQPVFYSGSMNYPVYQAGHGYSFPYTPSKPGRLAFSIGDVWTIDNSGEYRIDIYKSSSKRILPLPKESTRLE